MNDNNLLTRYFPAPDFLDLPYVGIDISPTAVRMMEVVDKASLKVGIYAEAPLSTPFIITGDHAEVKDILKKWKKEYKLEYIKASLPEEKAYLFDTEIEFGNAEKMRSAIEFSLEENVPLSGSDVIFDYRLIGESQKKGFVKVAVTVLPCDVVIAYLSLFHECEIQPLSFLIEAQALSRSLVKRGDRSTYLVVNIGKIRTGVFIVSDGAVQFTSTLPMGSADFTTRDNTPRASLVEAAAPFRQEIDKVYIYWNKHRTSVDSAVSIQKVILSGSDALTPGFREYLSKSLKMSVETGNVWANMPSIDTDSSTLSFSQALNFGAAIGLALPENE